jgi:alpha-beta hydrolase superfamily lysophospholipase
MASENGKIQTSDGLQLYTTVWLPEDKTPRAVVLLVHGVSEHIGRYAHVAEHLTADGYAVYGIDHRGHGRSDGLRVYINQMDNPANDLAVYFEQIRRSHPGLPFYVYGHSMGALIAVRFTLRYQGSLAGLIVSGIPLCADQSVPEPVFQLLRALSAVAPRLRAVRLEANAVSRDPEMAQIYLIDPMVINGPLRLGTARSIGMAARRLRPELNRLYIPLLVMHGSADRISDVEGSQYLYQHATSSDKTLKIFDGLYHEVHNEPERLEVLNDVLDWLNTRTK